MKHVNTKTRKNRVLSFVLALAMVVTLLPASLITARAEEAANTGVKLYFKLLDGQKASDLYLNPWGGTIVADSNNEKTPTGWGNAVKGTLESDKAGFSYATLTSNSLGGMQLVTLNSDGSKKTQSENIWNSEIISKGLKEAYLNQEDGKWYSDVDLKDEIKNEIKNVFIVVGEEKLTGASWNLSSVDNDKNTFSSKDNKTYTLTYKNLQSGNYEFKVQQDPEQGWKDNLRWGGDSLDKASNGNSILKIDAASDVTFTLDATDKDKKVNVTIKQLKGFNFDNQPKYVVKGNTVDLDTTAKYFDETIKDGEDVKVSYKLADGVKSAAVSGAALTVDKEYADDSVKVVAYNEEKNCKQTVSIPVVEKEYTLTVNFYDQDWDTSKSDIWLWENGGSWSSDPVVLSSKVEDTDSNVTWASGTVKIPFTKLGMKSRKTAGTWDGGSDSADRTIEIPKDSDKVTVWYVNGDGLYLTKPKVEKHPDRYIDFTYTNTSAEADKAIVYSWSINNETHFALTKQADGTRHVVFKVPYGVTTVMYVLALDDSGHDWIKDGGDHAITFPKDQNLIFVTMDKGSEPVVSAPYNKGYEFADGKVNFYYRDDQALVDGKLSSKKVSVEIKDGETVPLTWNEKNKRFEGNTALKSGKTYYRYDVDGEKVTDAFNTEKSDVEGYSVLEYYKLNANVTASLDKGSIDYNTNDVVSVKVDQVKAEGDKDLKVAGGTVDATALGAGIRPIDPDVMAVTIACDDDIKPGEYELPVSVTDQYGNVYTTSVKEKVTERTKKSAEDFDWDEASIYFMVTDRFFDGDSSNNTANDQFITDEQKKAGITTTYGKGTTAADGLYHGGDFKGIENKLDYLKDLGINTIWITPVVQNIAGVTVGEKQHGDEVPYNAAYHGYWASDFTKLNPALGTDDDFKSLINTAHSKGIKIMVDIVVNHAGYGTENSDNFNGMIRTTQEAGDQKSSLSNLPDFKTEDPAVRAKLVEWQTAWVKNFGIDYFRVDTVKHVDVATWQALKNSITDVDPSFKMIGEYSGGGASFNGGTLGTGAMDSDLDFDFNDWATQFVKGSVSSIEKNLTGRNSKLNNTYMTGQFLGSHDEDGFVYKLTQAGMSQSDAQAAGLVAASLQLTAKGQPVIYYGEEVGQSGANNYPYQDNRYDFDWSKANDSNPVFAHYKRMLSIRNQYIDVYARGDRKTVDANDANGYDVFTRSYKKVNLYNILNTKNEAQKVTLSGFTAGKVYTDLYSGTKYTADGNGNLVVDVPAAKDGGTVVVRGDDTKDTPVNPVTPSNPAVTPVTPDKPVTPVEPAKPSSTKVEVTANADGTFTGADGKTVTNSVVETTDGKLFITDESGKAVKDAVVETSDGKKFAATEDGSLAVSEVVRVDGKNYLATSDASLATEGIVKVSGKKYAVTEDQTLAKKGIYDKKYVVKNNKGQLGKNEIVSIKTKNKTVRYYANKNGKIVKNKLVKVKGKKYFTNKNGQIITSKWVKKGNKKYYCSKSGKITKTKTIKAKKSSKKK